MLRVDTFDNPVELAQPHARGRMKIHLSLDRKKPHHPDQRFTTECRLRNAAAGTSKTTGKILH